MFKQQNRHENAIPAPARHKHAAQRRALGSLAIVAILTATIVAMHHGRGLAALPAAHLAVAAGNVPAPLDAKPKPDQNICAPRLPWDTIRQQTALDLHGTVAQIRVLVLHGKPIQDVAAAKHVTLRRLHAIELHALQVGNARWIRLGCNTKSEGDAYMRIYSHMTPTQLNQEFTSLFVES
jgi:hypothetical protein